MSSRSLIVLPDDAATPILEAIGNTKKTLRIKMFVFSDPALIDAFNYIRLGKCPVIVSGGSEAAIYEAGVGGFNALHAMSTRNDDPATATDGPIPRKPAPGAKAPDAAPDGGAPRDACTDLFGSPVARHGSGPGRRHRTGAGER